jgi:outer membrane protein TolC
MKFKNQILLVALILFATNSVAQDVQFTSSISTSTISTRVNPVRNNEEVQRIPGPKYPERNAEISNRVNLDSIIQLTYQINPNIAAAKYDLEAAEYAYLEFERDLSQFTPFKLNSSIDRTTDMISGSPQSSTHDYSNSVGFQKDYFNGASISASVGHQGTFGDDGRGNNPYLEFNASYPLFSSHATLSRIISRSYEENQLYSSRLSYINDIKWYVRDAQLDYIWLQVEIKQLEVANQAMADLKKISELTRVQSNPAEKKQIEGELQSAQSEVVKYEGEVNDDRIGLQSSIGYDQLVFEQIDRMDLYASDFYGKEYLQRSKQELMQIAERDDIAIKVLESSKQAAEVKWNLAQKGKWDFFLNLNATYDLPGQGAQSGESEYYTSAGISADWIDPKLLTLSLKKAEAEIKQYIERIRAQKLSIKNSVDRDLDSAKNRRKQVDELLDEVSSRRKVYDQKLVDYTAGKESIDNLIQSRKNLYSTEMELADVLGEFYETVTSLDLVCNVYFQKLKIDIVSLENKSAKKK